MAVRVNCPYCLTPCEVPDAQTDKPYQCGNCQKPFKLKFPGAPAPKPPPAPAAAAPKPPPPAAPKPPPAPAAAAPKPPPPAAPKPPPAPAAAAPKPPPPAAPKPPPPVLGAKAPDKPRAAQPGSDATQTPKAARPKSAPAVDVLEVVDLDGIDEVQAVVDKPKKRPQPAKDANPFKDLAEPVTRPAKKKRSWGMMTCGCLAFFFFLVLGGGAAGGAYAWYKHPTWLGPFDPHAVTNNGTTPGIEPLSVQSQPPANATRDKPYTYQVDAKSAKGSVKYKLDSAPSGMKVSPEGKITWNVPADFDNAQAEVLLTVSDASGQEIAQPFKITVAPKQVVAGPKDPMPPNRDKPPTDKPPNDKPPPENPPVGKKDREEISLPSAADDICLGGGGRFVILSLPKEQKLAVFDVHEHKVVKYLPLGEDGARFAAGLDKLFVLFPVEGVLQRWSLRTFEKELTIPLPVKGTGVELCMGHASTGPLALCLKAPEEAGKGNVVFLDPATLKPLDVDWSDKNHSFSGPGLRASADGTVFASQQDWRVVTSVQLRGKRAKISSAGLATTSAWPSADGRTIYTSQEVCNTELKSVFRPENSGNVITLPFIPSQQGDFFLRLEDAGSTGRPGAKGGDIKFFVGGHQAPFATWKDFDGVFGQALYNPKVLTADKRYLLLPDENLLVYIPGTNDQVVLLRFDVDDLLAKSGRDFLLVTSNPVNATVKARTYTYQVVVKSKKGNVKYKLESAPKGMTVSPDGKITWDVPADFTELDPDVILTVSDAGGSERFHTFKVPVGTLLAAALLDPNPPIGVPSNEPVVKGDKLVNPPGMKLDIKPPTLAGEVTVTLPSPASQACVGGGGRFLILHLPKEGKLAVFDVNEARVVKLLPVGEDKVLFAAGMTKLLVVLPEKNVLQRWSLLTYEREVAVPLPVKGTVQAVAMGSAAAGPLVVGSEGADGGTFFLDITTLKEIPVEKLVGDNSLAYNRQCDLHVSMDGSVLCFSPKAGGGLRSVLLWGNTYLGFANDALGAGVPGPDGKILFANGNLYTNRLRKIGLEGRSGTLLPALQGNLYMTVFNPEGNTARNGSLSFHLPGDGRAVVTYSKVEGLDLIPDRPGITLLPLDQRVFLVPQANLLAILSGGGEMLCLQRFDLDAALDKSGIDYLVVTSQPEGTAMRGTPFEHHVQVKSKKGKVTFKLGAAPKDLKLTPEGKITWDVPLDFAAGDAEATVQIGDASGQEIAHRFKLTVASPPPLMQDTTHKAFEIKTAPLKGDKEERPLNGATDQVCLGGGGRFVLLTQPKDKKVAVFDVNEANVVKYLSIEEDGIKIAASIDKLYVALPAKATIQRWSLRTLEMEQSAPLPFKGTVTELCIGHAARGPLVVGLKEVEPGKGNLKYLNADTLQPIDLEYVDRSPVFIGRHLRASADGRVFAAVIDSLRINCVVLNGKKAQSYLGTISTNLAIPSPDGHAVYAAWDGFGPEMREGLKLDNPGPPQLPFLPAQQGSLFMRLDDHVTREVMKNPKTPLAQIKEGGDIFFYLPGQRTPFATWKDFEGVFGKNLLTGAKSLTYDERYMLLPSAGVLITVPATNDRLNLHRFDLDDLLNKSGKEYLFVASTPVTTALKGGTYAYPVVVKSKRPGVTYEVTKSPPGMKVTTDGKLLWDVPADFPNDDAEVSLKIATGPGGPVVEHGFKIGVGTSR
jgi:hypothetical protein